MAPGIFSKLKKLVQAVGKGVSWVNDKVNKQIMPSTTAHLSSLGPAVSMVAKGISAGSSAVEAMKAIQDILAPQIASPYVMQVKFTVSILLDDLFIFVAYSEYPNSLFGDFKIKFKINPQSLTFQYTNMCTQIGCTADFVTGIRAEELTPSGLKSIVRDVRLVIIFVRNYVIKLQQLICVNIKHQSEALIVGAALSGLKTSQNIPLYHVTEMYLIFSKDPRCTTCFENTCYQNIQVTTLAIDEFEDSLATPRGTTRRYNPNTDITLFFITLQCECNSNCALIFDRFDTQNQNTSVEPRRWLIFKGAVDIY
ncbi:MAG: hypothetical protein EZS28_009584 [Streblomastix strix]|uniref:Uncharacterized protein n=1 Tax=Streblomastix strix TaxID=222440 RepID=A0A5J4WJ66_9EUKA|nr:MAG: hypothetical protein EZS28_009584 [Streblomastix strix]